MRKAIMGCIAACALIACSGEGRDWRSAEAADTVEAYDQFLEKHPEGEHVTQARARLEQLAEDREWQRATTADTAAAYREFLAQHPNGKWAGEARIRVENFALTEAAAAAERGSVVAPDRAASVSPAGSGFGIQLGAFSTEAAAQAEWQQLQSRHRAQLGALNLEVQRAASASGAVFRLQVHVGAEARARGICAALAQALQPCVVVLPPR
jgi:hypothetical protein